MAVRTVFLTGASGFVGTHVADGLLRRGCEVRCLIRPGTAAPHLDRPGIVRVAGRVEDPGSYRDAIRGCDTVLHLAGLVAARRKRAMLETNGRGTARLADACTALETPPRFVAVSSLAAAGPPVDDRAYRDEQDSPAPVSIYGRSKRAGEIALEHRAGRLPVTIVRPGIVYGPGDRQGVAIFRAIQRTGVHVVVGFRTPRLSLIHVEDLVDLLVRAVAVGETLPAPLAADAPGRGIYLACDDREHPTYWQFGQRIAGALGRRVLVCPLWQPLGCMVGSVADLVSRATGTVQMLSLDKVHEAIAWNWACSAAKARTQLGFAPTLPLDARLRQTADWFREHGWL